MVTVICGGSLIEGSFTPRDPDPAGPLKGNLEAVVLDRNGHDLYHHWRDWGRADRSWNRGGLITAAATGPGAICQRRKSGTTHGNFEVLVQEADGLAHYWLDNSVTGPRPWRPVGIACAGATGPGAILHNRANDDLEAVALHGHEVVHHRFDRTHGWRRMGTVTARASGPPTMIQSSFAGHLEVVVPEGDELVLYWFDGSWKPGGLITTGVAGPVGFVQGRYGVDPDRNFEVTVPRGDVLAGYWRDHTVPTKPWLPAGVATWGAQPVLASALCSSSGGDGWLQVLTQEGGSVYHLYRHRVGRDGFRWMRSACLRLDDTSPNDVSGDVRSERVAQITGEPDAKTDLDETLSHSITRSGIRGTDLGVRVDHEGRSFLLFGDTHWQDRGWTTLDSIAEVRDPGAEKPDVVLHGSPLRIVGGDGTTDREYDVPLDAFSARGELFTFFSSNHFLDGKVMGRSVLTRAVDPKLPIGGDQRDHPVSFQFLGTFSWRWFINVSVQLRPAASVPGFEDGPPGDVLLLWGSGGYRADDLRLAVIDLREPALWGRLLGDRAFAMSDLGVRYFSGLCGDRPLWSWHEDDARPVLFPCALGELSVRWVEPIGKYVLLAMSGPDDPIGACVWLRTAAQPWGPWSNRRQVFDWVRDGLGTFMHVHGSNDGLGDGIFGDDGGGGYAPYLFDATVADGRLVLRYTFSTWNPYQSMLMKHEAPADLP